LHAPLDCPEVVLPLPQLAPSLYVVFTKWQFIEDNGIVNLNK
jgi:hypothetical protein